jgi:hypothetical protein
VTNCRYEAELYAVLNINTDRKEFEVAHRFMLDVNCWLIYQSIPICAIHENQLPTWGSMGKSHA